MELDRSIYLAIQLRVWDQIDLSILAIPIWVRKYCMRAPCRSGTCAHHAGKELQSKYLTIHSTMNDVDNLFGAGARAVVVVGGGGGGEATVNMDNFAHLLYYIVL